MFYFSETVFRFKGPFFRHSSTCNRRAELSKFHVVHFVSFHARASEFRKIRITKIVRTAEFLVTIENWNSLVYKIVNNIVNYYRSLRPKCRIIFTTYEFRLCDYFPRRMKYNYRDNYNVLNAVDCHGWRTRSIYYKFVYQLHHIRKLFLFFFYWFNPAEARAILWKGRQKSRLPRGVVYRGTLIN